MTQEEFEDIVNKTCQLAREQGRTAFIEYWNDIGRIEIEEEDTCWAKIIFISYDENLKAIEKWMPVSDAAYLFWLTRDELAIIDEFGFVLGESLNREQSLWFATCDLNNIKKWVNQDEHNPNELFKAYIGDCAYASPWSLLINPRKDVVDWALKTFDYKGNKDTWLIKLINERQAIPELKELILNTLGKKGE